MTGPDGTTVLDEGCRRCEAGDLAAHLQETVDRRPAELDGGAGLS